jgi:hypothetical protein
MAKLGDHGRTIVMNALLPDASAALCQRYFGGEWLERQFRDLYNERQIQYSRCQRLFPEGPEGSEGTLVWKFGRLIGERYANTNPIVIAFLVNTGLTLYRSMHQISKLVGEDT